MSKEYTYNQIKTQAFILARFNVETCPELVKILWFPDTREIRLVESDTDDRVPKSVETRIEPFYFGPSVADRLFVPTAVSLIRSDEMEAIGSWELPEGWDLSESVVIYDKAKGGFQ